MPELLNCPFCGGKAVAFSYITEGAVHCSDCYAAITRGHKHTSETGYTEAIRAWNTRAASLPEVRDLMRRAYAAGWDAYHAQQQADWTDTRGVEATRDADLDAIAPAPDLAALPEVRAMIRQAMAAWQMAYDEPDRDTLDRAEADRISAQWFAHWMRLSHPTDSENMPHHGDCIGENISCLRCIADDVLGSVDAALERAAAIREGRT